MKRVTVICYDHGSVIERDASIILDEMKNILVQVGWKEMLHNDVIVSLHNPLFGMDISLVMEDR